MTEDKDIVTSAVENTSQVETTSVVETKNSEISKTEETQTSNQQNIYEDGEKYSWFKQPVYDFDDVEPIVDLREYMRDKIEYSDAFRVKKGDNYGLIDSEGIVKIEIIYDELVSTLCRNTKGYNLIMNEEINTIDFEYKPAVRFIGGPVHLDFCWDVNKNELVRIITGDGSLWRESITDDTVYVAEYIEENPNVKEYEEWNSYLKLGKFALCKDNKIITNEVYTSVTDLVDNCVAFEKDGKWGYLNEKGEQILPFEFDVAYENIVQYDFGNNDDKKKYPFICTEGIIAAFKDGQCGYYDNKGNVIVEMGVFEDITPVKDGKAFVKKDGKWGIIKINE
jgi:hypothetical protein